MTDKPILRRLSGRLFLLLLLAALMRPAVGETIQLERSEHGTYTISVQINGAMVLPFVLDTGASLVVIPEDVFRTLTRTGTVTKNDFIGTRTAMLADGSEHASESYVLHEVQVGDHIVRNVVASVVRANGGGLARTHSVGAVDTLRVGGARVETIGTAEMITVEADRSVVVGATQTVDIASSQSVNVGSDETLSVAGDQVTKITGSETVLVGNDRSSRVGGKESVDAGKTISIFAGTN